MQVLSIDVPISTQGRTSATLREVKLGVNSQPSFIFSMNCKVKNLPNNT